MSWVISVDPIDQTATIINKQGDSTEVGLKDLTRLGVPSTTSRQRFIFEDELSSLRITTPNTYLAAFGFNLTKNTSNKHTVFSCLVNDVTIHIPALVLMRAFFRPVNTVFSIVFKPAGIDELSFIGYNKLTPQVVIDHKRLSAHIATVQHGISQGVALSWLQLSKSAKKTSHSVYTSALNGQLSLSLPSGQVKMILHGKRLEQDLFVTKASLIFINVDASDNLSGATEEFLFHAMADASRTPAASIRGIAVPQHRDGTVLITDNEWNEIGQLLFTRKQQGFWKKMPKDNFLVSDLTSAFGRWKTSGRLDRVLTYLEGSRNHKLTL